MKIANIVVNEFGKWKNLKLGQFSDGISVIFGPHGSGKTTVKDFLHGVFFGFDGPRLNSYLPVRLRSNTTHDVSSSIGYLEVQSQEGLSRVSRVPIAGGPDPINQLNYHPTANSSISGTPLPVQLGLDETTYSQFFNIGFADPMSTLAPTISSLTHHYSVPLGRLGSVSAANTSIIRQKEELASQIRALLETLNGQRSDLLQKINSTGNNRAEIDSLTRQINHLTTQIRNIEIKYNDLIGRSRELDIEIQDLREQIDFLRQQGETITIREKDVLPQLLQKLDSIEQQLVRWHKVQVDVQGQRTRLKEELVDWLPSQEVASEFSNIPYEDVRTLIQSIESRVDDMSSYVNQIESYDNQYHTRSGVTGNMHKTLGSMKEEIYQLCRELNEQHLAVKRKMVVNELKQLRRCYAEVSEHIKRLSTRREDLIAEVRRHDAARADLIQRASHQICQCNHHEQYLTDRQRTEADMVRYERREANVSAELARLHQLEDDRRRIQADMESIHREVEDLKRRNNDLILRRDGLKPMHDVEAWRRELTQIERRIEEEDKRLLLTIDEIEREKTRTVKRTSPFLEQAETYLRRISNQELGEIWLNEQPRELCVARTNNQQSSFMNLSRQNQDLVRLSLALTAAKHENSNSIPLVLDDLFSNLDLETTRRVVDMLIDYKRTTSRQILLFTSKSQILQMFASRGITTMELPSYQPVETPRETTRYPQRTELVSTHLFDYIEPETMSTETIVGSTHYLYNESERTFVEPPTLQTRTSIPSPTPTKFQIDEGTLLGDTQLIGPDQLVHLRKVGVRTVGDLLNFDPSNLDENEHELEFDQVHSWQAQSLLMLTIPQLRATDAMILYLSGIRDPEDFNNIDTNGLANRIQEFSRTTRGRRMMSSGFTYDHNRLNSWRQQARSNYERYSNRFRGYRRRRNSHRSSLDRNYDQSNRVQSNYERSPRPPRETRSNGQSSSSSRTSTSRTTNSRSSSKSQKFYLDLTSDIEAGPSIGPRTAERFYKIGIRTVAEFLGADAEQMAEQIDYKRIKASDVRAWQQQATLVCRIPQLRGHDAQFLVACGVTEPEDLAGMDPEKLFGIVGPYSKTREGQKIVRSGKAPDLAEIKDWISWAQQTRALAAA